MSKVVLLREELGFSQKEFAVFLGLSPSTVNSWETRGNIPSSKMIALIVKKIENKYNKSLNTDFFHKDDVRPFNEVDTNMRIDKRDEPAPVSVRNSGTPEDYRVRVNELEKENVILKHNIEKLQITNDALLSYIHDLLTAKIKLPEHGKERKIPSGKKQ
jgi:transcriptional regulator with XRE-family HTH domain